MPHIDATVNPANRELVVLFHASASSGRQWEALRQVLEPRFRVCAVDLHGHGERPSWRGAGALALADEAAIVTPLLQAAGGAHLVGHSYGGAVALKVAALHPHLVRSLVVYEPVLFRWIRDGADQGPVRDIVAVAEGMRAYLASGRDASAAQLFIDFWSGAGTWAALPVSRQDAIVSRMRDVLRHFDALFADLLRPAELARLSAPLLVLTGTDTPAVTRALGERMRRELPSARHEAAPGMGHMGPLTHPAVFNRRVAAFLHMHTLRGAREEGERLNRGVAMA